LTAYFTPGEVVVNLRQSTVRMRYLGANAAPDIDGADMQEGRANYLIGDDPSLWRTNVPLYGRVVYKDLYPGIDMVYSSHKRLLKSEFVVAPGADPSQIRIAYTGVESLRIDDQGGLILTTAEGDLREEAPEIYQEESDGRDQIEGAFRVAGNVVTFSVGQYDRSRPLRIDPVLSYSTYLGGGGTDRAYAIAVDGAGAAYVTGYTDSTNFPVTAGVVRPTSGGGVDAFVTKLNAAGSAIVYSTYLGGNGDDRGFSIAVDASGNAYITGYTSSTNFPLSSPFQATLKGPRDAFVTKLNPSGSAPIFSTYLGGTGDDRGNGIAVSASGLVYVTGSTTSSNFPLSSPFQATLGGQQDGFVTKLNSTGSALLYSTYLGGAADDRGSSIALDSGGAAYIAGNTSSTNFPTASPLQAANNSATDAFVTKLSAAGALVYSTYLGGSGTENIEVGRSIAVDSAGSAYIAGTTTSTNFPLFQPLQAAIKGGIYDAFVVKLTSAGTAFVFSTFLGGSSIDFGQSIAVDSSGNSYVTGYTSSTNFPIVNAGQPVNGGGNDTFVLKLNASGTALTESGFLGGGDTDTGYGIAIDNSGNAYVTGLTLSSNFPLLGPVQSANGGTLAAFVSKFTFGATGPPTAVSVSPASGNGSSQTFSLLYSDSRGFADINFVEMNWNATQSTANACYLRYSRATGVLQLATNAGSGWIGSATIGAAGTLANTQCSVDAGASSASGSGNNLTVTLVLTFNSAFAGSKNIYMQVQDTANTLAPWQARGTWTVVVSAPPAAVSVSPASGSGTTQAFSFAYSDTLGFTDINFIEFLFQSSLSMQNACYARYVPFTNILSLYNDAATGYAGAATLGAAGTLTNGQCTINVGASSVQGAGDNLTLTVALTFKPAFGGAKNIYMIAVSQGSVSSGWQAKGTWSVPIAPDASAVSVSPASGSGSSQLFSFLYSDLAGYADINWVQIHFQTQLVAPSACYLQYTRTTNVIQLVSDSGDGYAGSLAVGIAGTLNNSQCTLDAGSSSVSVSGTNLTLNLALVFKPAFAGAKNISMGATNNANAFSGWQAKGTWTVTSGGSLPAASVSVTPAAGAGSSQTFGFLYSDSYGFTDINWVQMHIQTQLVANAACYIQYTRSTHNVQLINDAGTGFVGAGRNRGVGRHAR
jgi:hypothetical protein